MKNNYIIPLAFIFIITVTILTSFATVYFLAVPLLKAPPQEGTIEITNILPLVDVIIIDGTIVAGISDTIQFTNTVAGGTYTTDLDPTTANPFPFVIRNNGNVRANIEIDERRSATQTNLGLFSDPTSRLKYWIEQSRPISGTTGYNVLDNCIPVGSDCFVSASCSAQPNPTDTNCIIPLAANPRALAISSLNFIDTKDEVFLNILIRIGTSEPVGTKTTIVTITGSQA